MNRLTSVSTIEGRSNGFAPDQQEEAENRLQWVQSTCEQLGDGYLVFSMWQCLGMGGVMWREPGSGALYRAQNEEWLNVFHEEDQAVVSLGLADPTTNCFPPVRVQDRRDGAFKRARMRLFYPPFESAEGLFVVVLQLESQNEAPSPEIASAQDATAGVFAATSAELLVVDIEEGMVESANPAFLKRNHVDASAVVGRSLETLSILDPEVAKVLLGTVEIGGTVRRRPIVLASPGRASREMLLDVSRIGDLGHRHVFHFVDVTVHNSATRHLSSILNHLPVGVFTKDPEDGTYLLSNVAADAFFGHSNPLRGQTDEDLFPPEIAAAFTAVDRTIVERGKPVEVQEFAVKVPGEETRLFDILRAPVRDARGHISRILGMVREVTADVQARKNLTRAKDEADRANRAKDEFLVNVGHEIRTPMNAILGFSKLLAETELDEEQFDLNREVHTSGKNLSLIIDSILDLSQISGGSLELEIQEFDLEGHCEELVEMLQNDARARGLDLHLILDPATPARVLGDPLRLRQILSHVVGNAIKFTESGRVELAVGGKVISDRKAAIEFVVRDTGIGIPENKREAIFEPFVQADSSETRSYEGTGLGLTLSQKLAEAMGSRITVESEMDHGSVFRFNLEFAYDGSGTLLEIEEPPPPAPLHILGKDRRTAENISLPLAGWGAKTLVAEGPEDLDGVAATVQRKGVALVIWDALSSAQKQRLPELILSTQFPGRWIVAIAEAVAVKSLGGLASHVHLVEPRPRTSHLRMAHLEAAEAGEVELSIVPNASRDKSEPPFSDETEAIADVGGKRVLIIDDDGMHRRVLRQFLQGRKLEVDTCSSEHHAYVLTGVNTYDIVFFESSFVGIDTPRMLEGIRRASHSGKSPHFVGLAFTVDEGRKEALYRLGVSAILEKPINPDALDACLRVLS